MKVKNVVFSGFAAAMFATVCGAASAATVGLISKDYADSKLQGKLTAGNNIEISDNNTISTKGLVQSSDYDAKVAELVQSISDEATARENADEGLQTAINGKVAQGDFNTLSSKVDGIDSAYKAADQDLQSEIDAVKALTGTEGVADQIANAINVEKSARESADQNLQSAIDAINHAETGILKSAQKYADQAEADAISAAAADAEKYIDAGELSASQAEQNTELKKYADDQDAALKSELEGQILTVSGSASTVASDLASYKIDNDAAVAAAQTQADKGVADAAAAAQAAAAASAAAAKAFDDAKTYADGKDAETLASAKTYAEGQASAAQSAAEATAANALNEYKQSNNNAVSALEGRVAVNEGDIDDLQAKDIELAGDIAANETAISTEASARESADNALSGRIITLEGAGYQNASQVETAINNATADMFNGAASAGSYLVNFDASGNASYAPVQILDGQGAPYDLTSGAVQSK